MVTDVALQQEAGVPSRILTPAEVADIVPGASIDAVLGAAYCAEDGYFDKPQAVVEAFADACRRLGVVIEHRTILGLEITSSGWQLRSAGSRPVQADAVVLAAGYDTPVLLDGLEVDLPMTREPRYLFFSDPIKERLLEPLVISPERQFAAKQLANGRILASDLSAHGDPDRNETSWRASVREKGRELLPALEYVTYPILVEGFYDVTPDHQAVIGPVDGLEGVWLAAGFSGHGFMMAPAIGRIVADGILDRSYDPLLEAFRPERFQQGSLVPELQIV
jgi:sarcosine oxidase subunit beta